MRVLRVATAWAAAVSLTALSLDAAPVRLVPQEPVRIATVAAGVVLVDFGRVAFGNVRLIPPPGTSGTVTVHFGEALLAGRVNRTPPGSVRYSRVQVSLDGSQPVVAAPPPDPRNTRQPAAILTPPEWGVVTPFRWIEIEGWPGDLRAEHVRRQAAFASTWDDEAAAFQSSDDLLDRIWELCRYSVKATTFAGVYVDGDRERIPYEADAYLNQLSHYATDHDVQMARDTFDHLLANPTWPTEWAFHMIFIAHADWLHTGDTAWLAARYEALKPKLLLGRAREDGLLVSGEAQRTREDIVDWPAGERDGFVFTPVNTVVNAFHLRALALMADLAAALGRDAEAADYRARERAGREVFQRVLFDPVRGVYRDGEGTDHASLHASLFPLAFGLVPPEHARRVAAWLVSRGMACSVYAAQYLLEGLFEHGADAQALALMTAASDRSWRHMIESGTTITWEAWDQKYKPNQDWNHAWGAAPANLLPRYVLGARALLPGWVRAGIRPHPGMLAHAAGTVPTPRGPIRVEWRRGETFVMTLALPAGVRARVDIPAPSGFSAVYRGGQPVAASREGAYWRLADDVSGTVTLEVRPALPPKPDPSLKARGLSGNPVFEGWYADPEAIVYGDRYWIFPTWSDDYPAPVPLDTTRLTPRQRQAINPQYLKQTFLDAFSSKDLVHWTKHPRVLDISRIPWAAFALWAPSAIRANGKYYLFFAANDIQSDQEEGGIGVAVADRPEGPYADALGRPLVDRFHHGAQPIDPFVFRDDDGRHYLYYGGWKHCNVARLRADLLGFEPFPDGEVFKPITPEHYVEGPFVFRRGGKYYLMWSEGGWGGPNYSVAYAIGDSPTGPFMRAGKILQQDPAVATGAGHHSVIPMPGSDTWYIVYHRRPLGTTNGNHREVCIDEMRFNADGTIQPVRITFDGVRAKPVSAAK